MHAPFPVRWGSHRLSRREGVRLVRPSRSMSIPSSHQAGVPRLLFVGDSHLEAIKRALAAMRPAPHLQTEAIRFRKVKSDGELGDMDLDEVEARVRELRDEDVLACFIGGNQYNAFGLVQHAQPFDFHSLDRPDLAPMPGREIVAYRTLRDLFVSGLSGNDGKRIARLVAACRARVVQLAPPPPKLNELRILQRHESLFKEQGIAERGLTPATIRLKLWALQMSVLEQLCREWRCTLLPVPGEAVDDAGFLKDEFSADDATHGNESYGRLNIEQVLAFAAPGLSSAGGRP